MERQNCKADGVTTQSEPTIRVELELTHGKKDRSSIVNKTDLTKMLPQFYRTCLQSRLSAAQLLTLERVITGYLHPVISIVTGKRPMSFYGRLIYLIS